MDLKNPSLHKAVTQAAAHVTPESRATARLVDGLEAENRTWWEFLHPLARDFGAPDE